MSEQDLKAKVAISEIVTHEIPKKGLVSRLVKSLRNGETLPPILIGGPKRDRFVTGPTGQMINVGHGYMLRDGHHRLAALKIVYGASAEIDVLLHEPKLTYQHEPEQDDTPSCGM